MLILICIILVYIMSIATIFLAVLMILQNPIVATFINTAIIPLIIEILVLCEFKDYIKSNELYYVSFKLSAFLVILILSIVHLTLYFVYYGIRNIFSLKLFVKNVIYEYFEYFGTLFKVFTTIFLKVSVFLFISNFIIHKIEMNAFDRFLSIFLSIWSISSMIYTMKLLFISIADNHKEKKSILKNVSSKTFKGIGSAYFAGLFHTLLIIAVVLRRRRTGKRKLIFYPLIYINNAVVYIFDLLTFDIYSNNNSFAIFYALRNNKTYFESLQHSRRMQKMPESNTSIVNLPLLLHFTPVCMLLAIIKYNIAKHYSSLKIYTQPAVSLLCFSMYIFVQFIETINIYRFYDEAVHQLSMIDKKANILEGVVDGENNKTEFLLQI